MKFSFYSLITIVCFLFAQNNTFAVVSNEDSKKPKYDSGNFYPANHKYISYTGRIDFENPEKPKFWAPGVYVQINYYGTSCTIVLNDNYLWNKYNNYFEVVIDGVFQQRISAKARKNKITVGKNLPIGNHSLLLCKNTESIIGYVELVGFIVQKLLPPDQKPKRKIEFIGNSITCGTGSDLSEIPCDSIHWHDQHNAYMSYGPITARALNAQWHLSSASGVGLVHSCCDMDYTISDIFGSIGFNQDTIPWNFNAYIPDVVTIALGQNDGIQDSTTFCNEYVRFIKSIRRYYPDATIICLTSPMADKKLTEVLKKYLSGIVQSMSNMGDNNVYSYFFTKSYNSGCDGHPDKTEHILIANELKQYIQSLMKW
jgi:lysophospholipase L1-like esterase